MSAAIINAILQGVLPIVTWFFRNAAKKQEVSEKMHKLIDEQVQIIVKNNNLRKSYAEMRAQALADQTPQEKE